MLEQAGVLGMPLGPVSSQSSQEFRCVHWGIVLGEVRLDALGIVPIDWIVEHFYDGLADFL